MKKFNDNTMKNLILLTVMLITAAAMQNKSYCQQDNTMPETGNRNIYYVISTNTLHEIFPSGEDIKTPDLKRDNFKVLYMQNEFINKDSKKENRINEITSGTNSGTSILIGSGIGLATGLLIDMIYYAFKTYGDKSSPRNFSELFGNLTPDPVPAAPLILIPVGTTLFGALIGAAVAPEEHPSYELYGRNAGKRKTNDRYALKNTVGGL
jgi:hypothetical protein